MVPTEQRRVREHFNGRCECNERQPGATTLAALRQLTSQHFMLDHIGLLQEALL